MEIKINDHTQQLFYVKYIKAVIINKVLTNIYQIITRYDLIR